MKKIWEIKQEREEKLTALSNEVGLFFAFSDEQFKKGKEKHPDPYRLHTTIPKGV